MKAVETQRDRTATTELGAGIALAIGLFMPLRIACAAYRQAGSRFP